MSNEIRPKPLTVILDVEAAKRAHVMAKSLAKAYNGNDGKYGNGNSYHMQLVGKIGEEAVARMFDKAGIVYRDWFRDFSMDKASDLFLPYFHDNGVSIEVKTWIRKQWLDLGRAVRKDQYDDILRKSDALIWCSYVDDDFSIEHPFPVQIMGFNSLFEFDLSKKTFRDGNSWQVDLCLPMARFGGFLGEKRERQSNIRNNKPKDELAGRVEVSKAPIDTSHEQTRSPVS